MSRVLLVPTGLGTGGAEVMLLNLLRHMDRSGLDIHVLSTMDEGTTIGADLRALGLPVTCLGLQRPVPSLSAFLQLRSVTRRLRPQLIQGWTYHGNYAAWLARKAWARDAALAWSIHHCLYDLAGEAPLTNRMIRFGAKVSRQVDAIVYVSRTSRSQHLDLGYREKGALYIPNGFDASLFAPDAAAGAAMRAELGLPDEAVVVGHVGRLHPMKDHACFVRAAAAALAREPALRFVMVGRQVDDPKGPVATLVRELGIGEQVRLLGERRDVAALMSSFDIFCLSSWAESFPVVVGEAAATGLPCVVTDVGAASEIVGDSGRVVPPRDFESMATQFVELSRIGPRRRQELGARARERVVQLFSIRSVAAQYAQLWHELSAQACSSPAAAASR